MADTDPSPGSIISSGPVIVGVDGSSNAQLALSMAAEIARRFDLDLAVFHAIGLMTMIEGEHVPSEGHRDDLERMLRLEWCAALANDRDLRWRAELVYGSPADVLMKMGAGLDASFVVVGSRGVGDELALGSTSHHVVHHCDRPVVVVPPVDRQG
ncbi:MAG TPA: universal stress protein [Ilumatobacteraceae bacterium]|nr:universal stress protein [Ilumatobacteraceae bacterium]